MEEIKPNAPGKEWRVKYYDAENKTICRCIYTAENIFALVTIIHSSENIMNIISIEQLAETDHI